MIYRHGTFCVRSAHIRCGYCKDTHHTVAQVRVCGTQLYTDPETQITVEAWPCEWMIRFWDAEDGETRVRDCGHPAWATRRGTNCVAGHEHVRAEVRMDEGWDYADDDEAGALAAAGVVPVQMDGKPFILR